MTYDVLATGSSGNAVVINGTILIDCGVPFKMLDPVKKGLKLVLLTHIHSDHFKPRTVRALAKERPGLRWGCCAWMVGPLLEAGVDKRVIDVYAPGHAYLYNGDVLIRPDPLTHDVPNCGYHIIDGWDRLFYATDTATMDGIEANGYDLYLIEANHTREDLEARARAKLENGEYAYELRAAQNHLSKEQALDWLYQQMGPHSRYVFLHQHAEDKLCVPSVMPERWTLSAKKNFLATAPTVGRRWTEANDDQKRRIGRRREVRVRRPGAGLRYAGG